MFFVWIGLASSCFFALLAVYGASYSQAVLWISVGGCAVSLGFALWEQLKTHGYPKRKRLYYSVSLAIVILILGWGLIVWVPSTPTLDLAVSSQIDIDVQPRNSKPSEPVPTLPDKQSKIPPPAIKKEIPIKPKENLAELLIKKYPVEDPAIGRYPGSFIYYWLQL